MSPRVLIVDDDTKILASLKRGLRGEPYTVLTAASPEDALCILHQTVIDLVVVDECMPLLRGTDLLVSIRKGFPNVERIMLTGNNSVATAKRAINDAGVSFFLTKPCERDELRNAIRDRLSKVQSSPRGIPSTAGRKEVKERYLELLEKAHPGISSRDTDSEGRYVWEDTGESAEEILREIRTVEHDDSI